PAELVYFPFPQAPSSTYFGSSTNGLASGSTSDEAVLHGLFEVIERDVASFVRLGMRTRPVDESTLPLRHRRLLETWQERGFDVAVRYAPNPFRLAWLRATLWERGSRDPLFINEGTGCHLDREVALSRALAEAAQSRLTLIHGARDDVRQAYDRFAGWSAARKRRFAEKVLAAARGSPPPMAFQRVPDDRGACASFDNAIAAVLERLRRAGAPNAFVVPLADVDASIQVVRVVVPLLEHFAVQAPRIGRRLADYADVA
ncbi:MAG TPA: YcaO-like family protein, partial [Candidatus Eremiobacteraceae bacterium]|nr:YcaO-like family protein [Candidatus Eremiobacteraceae bacterium]